MPPGFSLSVYPPQPPMSSPPAHRAMNFYSFKNVYVFDPNRRNNKIEVGDASDVEVDKTLRDGTPEITVTGSGKTGVAAGEKALGLMDYAVGVEYDGDIIDVVIYKAFDFDWKFAD